MAKDIQEQVFEKLKNSQHFALQFDECTDVSDCVQFVVFLRGGLKQMTVSRKTLFCKHYWPVFVRVFRKHLRLP